MAKINLFYVSGMSFTDGLLEVSFYINNGVDITKALKQVQKLRDLERVNIIVEQDYGNGDFDYVLTYKSEEEGNCNLHEDSTLWKIFKILPKK